MKIELVNKRSELYPKLQAFVQHHQLLFNSASWMNNYSEKHIQQCALLNNNADIIGCFFYYTFKKVIYKLIISAPYAPDIELFYINPSESVVGKNSFNKEVSETIANYFDHLTVDYINLNLPQYIIDTQPFIWKGYTSKTRYSYLINLSQTEEELKNNLSSEKRKSLNKALKDNLEVQSSEDYELVYSLVIKSLSRNKKSKNTEIIKKILFSFANQNNSFAFVAYHKGLAIGATFCVVNKNKAMYLFGGVDFENKHHGAGVSCMWQCILKAKALNLNYFDFEGSMNENIERYFREFGGELTPYFCVEKVKPGMKIIMNLKKHNSV